MKKLIYFFSFILLFCFIKISFGFVDQRYQYWNIQLKTLNEEKNKLLSRKNPDKFIINLIKSDIRRTESILRFFERSLDTGTKSFEKKKYTESEINIEIKNILMPLFALNYLEFILSKIGTSDSYKLAEKFVNDLIDSNIHSHFGESDSLIRDTVLKEKFTKNDWKYLVMELWLGFMISNRDRLFDTAALEVKSKVSPILTQADFFISQKDLKNLIEAASKEFLIQIDFNSHLNFSKNPLTDSWCWNEKSHLLSNEFNDTNNIILLLRKANISFALTQIYSFRKKIQELEKFYFSTLSDNYYENIKALKENTAKEYKPLPVFENPYFLNIPDMPELSVILINIDEIRKDFIKNMNSNVSENSISDLEKKFDDIILTSISRTKIKFIDEENLLNDLNRQSMDISGNIFEENISENQIDNGPGLTMTPINKAEFDLAKMLFEKQAEMAYGYAGRSVEFIKIVSEIKNPDSNTIFNDISRRLNRNSQYIEALENLAVNCAGLETLTTPALHKRYHSAIIRISNLYNFLGYSLNSEKNSLKNLNNDQIDEINSQKESAKKKIAYSRKNISSIYISILKSLEAKRNKLKSLKHDIKDELANTELDLLIDSIKEHLTIYDRLKHTDIAFRKYAETFREIFEAAETGTETKKLDKAIKSHSIIPLVNNFSALKIKYEYKVKNYLKNIIYKRISSTEGLITFYKRKGMKINNIPADFLESVKAKLRLRSDIKIADWQMNESNFENIDKKAVQKLQFIMKRRIWNDKNKNIARKISIEGFKISLAIPDGWIEQSVSSWESDNGIIKSFKSIDGNSTIYIAEYDHSNNVKDASEFWINEMKSRKVAQEWGEKDASDYFWTLSDHKNGVMESYAISYRQRILILSGISTKDKYNFFKKKITSVFESISSI